MRYEAFDALGRDIRLGDWVRVIQVPMSVVGMPKETLSAFSAAIGRTFQVPDFDQVGCLELDLHQKLRHLDTIWLEPFCCVRSRRPKSPGRYFREHRALMERGSAGAAT